MEQASSVVLLIIALINLFFEGSQLSQVLNFSFQSRIARIDFEESLDSLFGLHEIAEEEATLGHTQVSFLELRIQLDTFPGIVQRFFVVCEHHVARGSISEE